MSAYRLFLILCGVGAFAGNLAFTLNIVYQAQVVGLGPLQLVLVGTVMEAVAFFAQVPTGVIADVYSRRLSVVIGYVLMGLGLLLWGLVPTFAAILAANAVWAIGAVCVDGAQEAWAADEIGEDRIGRAFARGGQIGQAGTVAGIVAAVVLASLGLAVPIVAAGALTVLIGVGLAVFMPENGWHRGEHPATTMWSQVALGGRAVRTSPILIGLVAGTLFLGMSSEGFDRLLIIESLRQPASVPSWLHPRPLATTPRPGRRNGRDKASAPAAACAPPGRRAHREVVRGRLAPRSARLAATRRDRGE